MAKGDFICQWADCQRDTQWCSDWCKEHRKAGLAAVDMAQEAALAYGDSQPSPGAYWAEVDNHPQWRKRWWEPRPAKPYRHIAYEARRQLARRYGGQMDCILAVDCSRCGARGEIRWFGSRVRFVGLHIDHVRPVARGGDNDAENLQLLCPSCNGSKGAKIEAA